MKKLLFSQSLFVLLLSLPAFAAPIYVIERADGSVTFTSRKPDKEKYSVFKPYEARYSYTIRADGDKLFRDKYHRLITFEAKQVGLDPNLVKAVIHAESSFNPKAKSKKGAMGLMQLMPETARMLGVKHPYLPEQNIQGGVHYLSQLLERYHGDLQLGLAAYNAGPNAVEKYNGIPPYKETQDYVKKVLNLHREYKLRG